MELDTPWSFESVLPNNIILLVQRALNFVELENLWSQECVILLLVNQRS